MRSTLALKLVASRIPMLTADCVASTLKALNLIALPPERMRQMALPINWRLPCFIPALLLCEQCELVQRTMPQIIGPQLVQAR